MNNWQIVGLIFLGFSLVFFVFSILVGLVEMDSISNTGILAVAMHKVAFYQMLPWIASASLCMVVAVVGLIAGRQKT